LAYYLKFQECPAGVRDGEVHGNIHTTPLFLGVLEQTNRWGRNSSSQDDDVSTEVGRADRPKISPPPGAPGSMEKTPAEELGNGAKIGEGVFYRNVPKNSLRAAFQNGRIIMPTFPRCSSFSSGFNNPDRKEIWCPRELRENSHQKREMSPLNTAKGTI